VLHGTVEELRGETGDTPSGSPAAEAPRCIVGVIRDPEEWGRLKGEWDELFEGSPTASAPLRWEWARAWWRVYGPVYGDRGRGLRILTVRRGPRLIGVLPLYRGLGRGPLGAARLGFLSTGAAEFEETCTDYLDLLHAPGEASACVEALGPALAAGGDLRWDELDLSDLPSSSPLLALRDHLAKGRRVAPTECGICPFADLAGGMEAYLQRLSAETRQQSRRLLRSFERSGMAFEVASDPATTDLFFAQMIQLHHQRWTAAGRPGSFAPRHAEFHRELARQLAPSGGVVLARLSLGGEPFAVIYGHRVGPKFDFYQQGVLLRTEPVRSPGTVAHLLLMAHLAERGVTDYDFLKGSNPFKRRYSTGERALARVRVVRPTLRSLSSASASLARRAKRKVWKVLGRARSRVGGPAGQPND
jgi:hypothetical protein